MKNWTTTGARSSWNGFYFFFSPVSSPVYTQCLLVFFLFPVALAKYLGVNITAQKYKDGAQFHKNNSRREHVVILHSRLITNKSKGLNLYTHWSPGNTNTSKISTGEGSRFIHTLHIGKFSLLMPGGENVHSERVDNIDTLCICVHEALFLPGKVLSGTKQRAAPQPEKQIQKLVPWWYKDIFSCRAIEPVSWNSARVLFKYRQCNNRLQS